MNNNEWVDDKEVINEKIIKTRRFCKMLYISKFKHK
jgi:hypothetical protein